MFLDPLLENWRNESAVLRGRGQDGLAAFLESLTAELQEKVNQAETEPLTLVQAAEESGLSAEHLGRLVRMKKMPNAGRRGSPRIRRMDLPRRVATSKSQRYDLTADAQNLLTLKEGL